MQNFVVDSAMGSIFIGSLKEIIDRTCNFNELYKDSNAFYSHRCGWGYQPHQVAIFNVNGEPHP
jgi:hypothetical protein